MTTPTIRSCNKRKPTFRYVTITKEAFFPQIGWGNEDDWPEFSGWVDDCYGLKLGDEVKGYYGMSSLKWVREPEVGDYLVLNELTQEVRYYRPEQFRAKFELE